MARISRRTFALPCLIACILLSGAVAISVSGRLQPGLYDGVLLVETATGSGSCFVVAHRGDWWYAITANHVVGPDMMVDGFPAEIVRADAEADVALVRFKGIIPRITGRIVKDYKIYSFAKAQPGEPCTTVGWSEGSKLVYKGNVVSVDLNGFIAANGGVVPGCSGGPLLNENGEVIGIAVQVAVYYSRIWDNTALHVPPRFAEALVITIN